MCIGNNNTISILNCGIVNFKDIRGKFTNLRCVRPCSLVGTKYHNATLKKSNEVTHKLLKKSNKLPSLQTRRSHYI